MVLLKAPRLALHSGVRNAETTTTSPPRNPGLLVCMVEGKEDKDQKTGIVGVVIDAKRHTSRAHKEELCSNAHFQTSYTYICVFLPE